METYQIKDLSFTYPEGEKPALCGISMSIAKGEFVTLCGKSGCGKTTLLRLLKPALSPFGTKTGEILFMEEPLADIKPVRQAEAIGYVLQNPENQIVTDKVWHELAFGLENLGYSTSEIRGRVSEMASFFGIESWFYQSTSVLSGGQKQLLNLASVMVMQPEVLILDEPTAQLDPIAAGEFLRMLEKINRELGTTVILSEHRLEEAFPISDRVLVLEQGHIIAEGAPRRVGKDLSNMGHEMCRALPTPMKIFGAVEKEKETPLTIREGRTRLESFAEEYVLSSASFLKESIVEREEESVIALEDVWFRYEKKQPDIIRGLSFSVSKGELFGILGGNGTGKTTILNLIAGLCQPYCGKVLLQGQELSKIPDLYHGVLSFLPQNPQALFTKKTVSDDLREVVSGTSLTEERVKERIFAVAERCMLTELLSRHPYDLSGGEQQRAALAKVLLTKPEILLLDEPTKGLDAAYKQIFAGILQSLQQEGVTILMVSHDIEFCAEYADRCALMFDGNFTSVDQARSFFSGKHFYTTGANRMARSVLPEAVLAEDVILSVKNGERKENSNEK